MKYTLCYAQAKLKAVKGKRLQGNTGIVHLSIVRWNLLKRNSFKEKRKQADRGIDFCIVFVVDYFIRDQFTFLAKVNVRVKHFSVCNLHLMENSKFLKHVT